MTQTILELCMNIIQLTVLLIILVISKSLTFASGQFTASDPSIKVHFGPIQKGKVGSSLVDKFIKFLGRAETTIDGAFYEIRDDRVVDAFIAAHKRGGRVRILLDSDYFFLRDHSTLEIDYGDNNPFAKRLIEAGIDVSHTINL